MMGGDSRPRGSGDGVVAGLLWMGLGLLLLAGRQIPPFADYGEGLGIPVRLGAALNLARLIGGFYLLYFGFRTMTRKRPVPAAVPPGEAIPPPVQAAAPPEGLAAVPAGEPTPPPGPPAPPPQYPYAYPPEPPRKPPVPVWVWPVVVLVGCGFLGLLPKVVNELRSTGIKSGGRNLTRSELNEASDEMERMLRNAKAGDASSIDTSYEPRTQLAKDFKQIFLRAQKIEADYAEALGGTTLDTILTPKRLSSAAGIRKSRKELEKLQLATMRYFTDSKMLVEDVARFGAETSGKPPTDLAMIKAEAEESEALMDQLIDTAEDLLAHAEKSKPEYDASEDQILYADDKALARDNEITVKFNTTLERFNKAVARAMRRRQESMARNLGILRK